MKQTILVLTLILPFGLLGCQKRPAQVRNDAISATGVVLQIEYRGVKSVSQPELFDRLAERGVNLQIGSQPDPAEIKNAQSEIKGLLAEHGHKSAVVKATYEKLLISNGVRLVFTVDEGRSSSR